MTERSTESGAEKDASPFIDSYGSFTDFPKIKAILLKLQQNTLAICRFPHLKGVKLVKHKKKKS